MGRQALSEGDRPEHGAVAGAPEHAEAKRDAPAQPARSTQPEQASSPHRCPAHAVQEHYTTIRLHSLQAHHIQRSKALANSFAVNRSVLQWDEVTLNHLAWSVIVLNAPRALTDQREREVISTSKLPKDAEGSAKTGKGVAAANIAALEEYDVPVSNIDFCCSDTTSYNSSLKLPRELDGTGEKSDKGGAYAVSASL